MTIVLKADYGDEFEAVANDAVKIAVMAEMNVLIKFGERLYLAQPTTTAATLVRQFYADTNGRAE